MLKKLPFIIAGVLVLVGIFMYVKREGKEVHAPASQPLVQATSSIQFTGHVARGEKFQKDIGNDLVFQLVPIEYGWYINIVSKSEKGAYGFTLATPPFHGVNPTQIEGWHFAVPAPNAPQREREFLFVLNNKDANTMADAINQYTSGKTLDFSPDVPLGKGELTVQNLRLGAAVPDQSWIEFMDFSVDINFSGGTYN